MRAQRMVMGIVAAMAVAAGSAAFAAEGAPPGDVLAAISADAEAGAGGAPQPPPPPVGLQSQAIDNAVPVQGTVVEPRAVCSVQNGSDWRQIPEQTLEQCAATLESGSEEYDAYGLKHAYWDGNFLSASAKAIYQSPNGHDWTKLRDRGAQ